MKSQRTTQQTSSRTRKPNTRYPSIYNLEDLTMLETSLGSTYRSKGTPSGPENLCENAPSSRRQDLKINEFATKSYSINAKELPPFPENLLETRESLDIGIERNEDNGEDIFTVIRSMTLMNKMNIKDRNSQKENVFDLHTKHNTSQNKKELGILKPLRELKLADKAQKELSMSACSHRMNGESKIGINAEGSNIKQLKGDYQEPKGLDLEEEIEGKVHVHAKNKDDIHKSRILSPSNTFRPDTNSVLKNIENYRYNTSNYDPTLNKPNPTMSLKRTKFQENVKDFVLKKRDENAGSSKPLTMHIKYGDKLGTRKSVVLKGGSTNIKSTMPVNKLEGISRSTKRVDSSLHSSRLGTRREDQRSNKIKRTDKNCADYFKNPVVMKNVLSFLCVNSLTKITRVSKNFRVSENLSFIKKLQSKLIARGLGKREQYEFWDLRLGFDSLQHAHPAQFAKNALKKSAFERDVLSDIDRTRLFNSQVAQRKECLLRILFAISNSMPKLGYVQGLNSIVAVFISQDLKDYEVYWLMKYILKKKKFDGILSDGFPMVQLLNYQLEIYVRHYLPEIISHLEERDLNISYFTTQWFITMFSYDLELSQLIKIWNLFLLKGWKTVIKVSLALLWHFKEDIMKKSADDLPFYLKNFLRERSFYISEDTLFKIADTFKVNNRILKTLEILHERSAPTNVTLFITPGQKPECKIASTHPSNKNSSVVYKDIMEYLNEDIDHMRIMNKTKGNVSNELDNYRSIQNANFCSNLIVDKQSGPSLNRNIKSSLNILDDATNIERLNSSQTQGSSMAQENGFLQTLSGLGKRLKQILTPKNDPPFLPRKFSDVKIINPEQEDFREPLSERPDHRPSIILDRANSKFDSVTNSLDFSSSSRSRDIGYQATDRQFEFTLGARNYTEMPSGRNAVLKSRQVDSPQSTAKSVLYPVTGEYKHKRNSSMPYDQFGILTTFRNSTTSYFEQTSPDNLSLTENDNYLSARLALEEIKGMRKSNNQGFYLSTETSVRKNIPLQKAYSLEERVRSSMNGLTSQIMNAPKRPQIERKY